jgi:VIT1/CCC1 family predicted Fe2+/Mn2+ transporter
MPEEELKELAEIYEERGLDKSLALQVAKQLTAHDALGAHARDELGINHITQAQPLLAALSSGAAFIFGGLLPVLVAYFGPLDYMEYVQYAFAVVFLAVLGAIAAKAGGSNMWTAILRISFWGTVAMVITALIGYLFDVNLA